MKLSFEKRLENIEMRFLVLEDTINFLCARVDEKLNEIEESKRNVVKKKAMKKKTIKKVQL